MQTASYISRTLLAGASTPVTIFARHIVVASISASTLELGIQDDPPQQILAGQHIDCEKRKYDRFVLRNAGAVTATVVLLVSDTWISLEASGGLLAAMAASLVTINQQSAGSAAAAIGGQLADTICPITPGPGVLLFAAKPLRTEVEIFAPRTNGAEVVYLGITAARATVIDKFYVLSAGEPWWSDREKGAIYACSSTGAEIVNGREC